MQRRAVFVVALTLFALVATNASANFDSGNDLVKGWRALQAYEGNDPNVNYLQTGVYMGFVAAIFDTTEFSYNIPERVTRGQLCSVVGKFLEDHPERWAEPATVLVRAALADAFPPSDN